ncbi:MAG TPA: peptidylprolyl isomerase [Candidatus Acidoferrales bacterium]|nr:peptidylprolyl isomerase [Candidatus Acidoferrales bacterium]
MKAFTLFVLCLGACVRVAGAQTAPPAAPALHMPDLPDETVVARFDDGTAFTMGDFKKYYQVLTPQQQQMALSDPTKFLHQWALFRKLTKEADEQKLGEQSPYKETIEYARMQVLIGARINEALNSVNVEPAEVLKYYEANKDKYKQVRVKAIYITFSSSAATQSTKLKRALTEDEAKTKAEKVLAEIRAGADFVKLVKEYSEDVTSKAKDGDFATLRPSDNIPDAFRSAVFALKPGEVSEPLRQASGFYLLRAEEVSYRLLPQVRDEIVEQVKHDRYAKWFEQMDRSTKVEITNPAFLINGPAAGK